MLNANLSCVIAFNPQYRPGENIDSLKPKICREFYISISSDNFGANNNLRPAQDTATKKAIKNQKRKVSILQSLKSIFTVKKTKKKSKTEAKS